MRGKRNASASASECARAWSAAAWMGVLTSPGCWWSAFTWRECAGAAALGARADHNGVCVVYRAEVVCVVVCLVTLIGLLTPRLLANKRDFGGGGGDGRRAEPVHPRRAQRRDGDEPRAGVDVRSMARWLTCGRRKDWRVEAAAAGAWGRVPRSPAGRRGSPADETRGPGVEEGKSEFVVKESYARKGPVPSRSARAAMWAAGPDQQVGWVPGERALAPSPSAGSTLRGEQSRTQPTGRMP